MQPRNQSDVVRAFLRGEPAKSDRINLSTDGTSLYSYDWYEIARRIAIPDDVLHDSTGQPMWNEPFPGAKCCFSYNIVYRTGPNYSQTTACQLAKNGIRTLPNAVPCPNPTPVNRARMWVTVEDAR